LLSTSENERSEIRGQRSVKQVSGILYLFHVQVSLLSAHTNLLYLME
jgi:hypothetical protein